MSLGDDALEAGAAVGSSGRDAIFLFVLREGVVYLQVENLGGVDFVLAEVEMNDGIPIPLPIGGGDEELWLLYAFLGGESFKEFTPPLKNGLECGTQQRLSEPPGTAHKIWLTLGYHLVDKRSLVHIHVSVHADSLKTLYSDRVFSQCCHNKCCFFLIRG